MTVPFPALTPAQRLHLEVNGFVLLPDQASAETLRAQALREFSDEPSLRFVISSACNHGSRIARLSSAKVVTEA